MGGAEAVSGMDRLPWLSDDARPRAMPSRGTMIGWTTAVIVVMSLAAVGLNSVRRDGALAPAAEQSSMTVKLPEATPVTASPERAHAVQPDPVPAVQPSPIATARITAPPAPKASIAGAKEILGPKRAKPTVPSGASGRLIQIGAFGSAAQARHGWETVSRAYPGVVGLSADVGTARNSKGTVYYRVQVGTTSQAHSEVLCQRMQKISLSCAVLGLPKTQASR